jgi:hypothetical protein
LDTPLRGCSEAKETRGGDEETGRAETLKVGRQEAERAVYKHECHKLSKGGFSDLVDRVIWHRDHPVRTPGWDITSFDEARQEIFIEVKGTTGKTFATFNLTPNEWLAAQKISNQSRYFVYLVTEALTEKPKILRVGNPFRLVEAGHIEVYPSEWELRLGRGAEGQVDSGKEQEEECEGA